MRNRPVFGFLGQAAQRQLHHPQEVITGQAVLVEHLEHLPEQSWWCLPTIQSSPILRQWLWLSWLSGSLWHQRFAVRIPLSVIFFIKLYPSIKKTKKTKNKRWMAHTKKHLIQSCWLKSNCTVRGHYAHFLAFILYILLIGKYSLTKEKISDR